MGFFDVHSMTSTQKRPTPGNPASKARKRTSTIRFHGQRLTTGRAHAQLVVGTSVSYGDGCRLNNVTALRVLSDYDSVAFEGQPFTQKASVRFHVRLSIVHHSSQRTHSDLVSRSNPTGPSIISSTFYSARSNPQSAAWQRSLHGLWNVF